MSSERRTGPDVGTSSADPSSTPAVGFPTGPLLATLLVQTLATGAAYSIPAVAPEVGRAVGLNPAFVGVFISIVYGVGIVSSLLSPGFIYRRGAVRASQAVLLATLAMVLTAALGSAFVAPVRELLAFGNVAWSPSRSTEVLGVSIAAIYAATMIAWLMRSDQRREPGLMQLGAVLLAVVLVVALAAIAGPVAMIALSAVLMGLAYGATAPSSTHLLVPLTPPAHMNVVLSLRQIGVPLGGMLAGLLMPPLALVAGWQTALLLQVGPAIALLAALETVRRRWDGRLVPAAPSASGVRSLVGLLAGNGPLQRLSFAAFVYSGLQICFIAFMTTQLTTVVGFDLVSAGQALALYQLSGVIARPIWGWIADHIVAARWLLALQGLIMCGAAFLAGRFAPDWPVPLVLLVCAVAGATASGYTGIAYAEYARLGGARRTEATGLGSAFMFAGVMTLPAATSVAVALLGSYVMAYSLIGLLALLAGMLLAIQGPKASA